MTGLQIVLIAAEVPRVSSLLSSTDSLNSQRQNLSYYTTFLGSHWLAGWASYSKRNQGIFAHPDSQDRSPTLELGRKKTLGQENQEHNGKILEPGGKPRRQVPLHSSLAHRDAVWSPPNPDRSLSTSYYDI